MKQNRNIFIFLILLFILSLGLPVIMVTRLNHDSLEKKYSDSVSYLKQFVQLQNNVYSSVASDNIIKSSLMQYSLNNGVNVLQSHLNFLKENFSDVKLVSLYDKTGKLFLSTDYAVVDTMNAYSLLQLNKPVYDLLYMNEYNQYLFCITAPLNNDFGISIGYLKIFVTLDKLIKKLDLGDDSGFFLAKNGKVIFAAPATLEITDDKVLYQLDKQGQGNIFFKKTHYLTLSHGDDVNGFHPITILKYFNNLMRILVMVNIIILLLIVYFVIRTRIERGRHSDDAKLKGTTDEILDFSQKALQNVYKLTDIVGEIRMEKEDLKKKIKDLKVEKTVGSGSGQVNDFKIIEPR